MMCDRQLTCVVLIALGAALGLGCGVDDDTPAVTVNQAQPAGESGAAQPQTPPSQTTPAPESAAAPPAEAAAPAPAAEGGAAAPAPAGDAAAAIATEQHEVPGVQVALTELRRTSGDTVTLRLQFRNTTDSDVSDSLFYGSNIASRTYLLDATRKKYAVLEDAEGQPVGYVGQSSTIKPGAAVPAWVRFPAPPADITTVTVVVPGVPPFEDIAIK